MQNSPSTRTPAAPPSTGDWQGIAAPSPAPVPSAPPSTDELESPDGPESPDRPSSTLPSTGPSTSTQLDTPRICPHAGSPTAAATKAVPHARVIADVASRTIAGDSTRM